MSDAIHLVWDFSVASPRRHVFDVLTDLETYLAQWAKGPVAVEKLSDGPKAVGTQLRVTAQVAGIRVRSPYEITGWEPDELFAGTGIAGPFRFDEAYRLTKVGEDRTDVHYEIDARPRGPFGLARGPLAKQLKTLIDGDLERFKQLVER